MTPFDQAFAHTVGLEGRYADNPADRGGPTMFGITQATARADGYAGAMADLPLETAKSIYRRRYWDVLAGDALAARSPVVAAELFDTAVNMGTTVAAAFLQRCLNALNRNEQDYPDVIVDGVLGAKTVSALGLYLDRRGAIGPRVLLTLLNALQGARYVDICERDRSQEVFMLGWVGQRVSIQ
jgi:lysozyme family protein